MSRRLMSVVLFLSFCQASVPIHAQSVSINGSAIAGFGDWNYYDMTGPSFELFKTDPAGTGPDQIATCTPNTVCTITYSIGNCWGIDPPGSWCFGTFNSLYGGDTGGGITLTSSVYVPNTLNDITGSVTVTGDINTYDTVYDQSGGYYVQGRLLFNSKVTGTGTVTFSQWNSPGNINGLNASFSGIAQVTVQPEPIPTINSPLVPSTMSPGQPSFTLTLNGTGFASDSVVNWNGSPRATNYISELQLQASILASDIAVPGTAIVTVTNPSSGGAVSNAAPFSITNSTTSVTSNRTDESTAASPEGIISADLNGDGKPDLVSANLSGTVSVILGNGDGTFQGKNDYGAGGSVRSVTAADFNNDGKLDLVTANQSANTVSILLGNGDGTFQAHSDYVVGNGPFSLAIGDFNMDGNIDLAVVNQAANTVSILLGKGDGTFEPHTDYATGRLPFGIVVGNFMGTGYLDLAVANYTDNTVSILQGNGDGTFSFAGTPGTAPQPEFLTSADFNGDGFLDLAVGTNESTGPVISILLNNGGSFSPHVDYPAGGKPRSLTVADLNGDGKSDIVTANYGSSNISLLLGNGDGTFQPQFTLGKAGLSPQAIAVGDFNGDGRIDVATANYGANTVSVLLQVPVVNLSPSALTFGNQVVGTTSAPQVITIGNAGSAPLAISTVSVTGDFSQTNTCSATVMQGGNCTVSVTFTPSAAGTRTGTVTIVDNAADSPQTVNLTGTGVAATTTTSLSSSLNPSIYGQSVTFTAKVAPSGGGTPTGTVTFYDASVVLGTQPLNSSGLSILTTSSLSAGSHSITASYSGDSSFAGSTSTALAQSVSQATSTVALSSNLNPSYVGQSVTFTAVVTGQYGGVPTGTVTFKQGTNVLATVALANAQASCTKAFATAGNSYITAVYSGDLNFKPKNSPSLKQVVQRYLTITQLQSSLNPSIYGQAVVLTGTVTSVGPVPTGSVTFKNGTTSIGTATLSNGVATLTRKNLPAGTDSLTAVYNGCATSAKSTSTPLSQTVNKASTSTAIKSSLNPSLQGQSVTFTATVTSPTAAIVGTVTFTAASTTLGTVPLSGGKANITTSTLPKGSTVVTATFNAGTNFVSSSASLTQVVQ
ncbi:MAG TPA: Ig-like domain repeat protein [Terriglobales bacterium]